MTSSSTPLTSSRELALARQMLAAQRRQDSQNPVAAAQRSAETKSIMASTGMNANQASIYQQQLANQRGVQMFSGNSQGGMNPFSTLGQANQTPPIYQPTTPTQQTQPSYNSSLQNQFAMHYLFSLMQAMTALRGGFGSFLGG